MQPNEICCYDTMKGIFIGSFGNSYTFKGIFILCKSASDWSDLIGRTSFR